MLITTTARQSPHHDKACYITYFIKQWLKYQETFADSCKEHEMSADIMDIKVN